MLALELGRRSGNAFLHALVQALERALPSEERDYVRLTGSCYAFEYRGLTHRAPGMDGAPTNPESCAGTILILPRFAPLYLPIARAVGREDTVRITLRPPAMRLGIGAIARETRVTLPFNHAIEDADLSVQRLSTDAYRYTLYAYNPAVAERLAAVLNVLDRCPTFLQLSLDSTQGSIEFFLFAEPEKIENDIRELLGIGCTLTAE